MGAKGQDWRCHPSKWALGRKGGLENAFPPSERLVMIFKNLDRTSSQIIYYKYKYKRDISN